MSLEKLMAELRVEYLAALPGKINEIEEHLRTNALARLRDDFHKLKGSGLTYGLPEISELCEVAEQLCDTKAQAANVFTPIAISILRAIHAERTSERELNLASSSEFAKLKAM